MKVSMAHDTFSCFILWMFTFSVYFPIPSLSSHDIVYYNNYIPPDRILYNTAYSLHFATYHQNGQTPFLLACEAGHDDTVRFLLACDAHLVFTKDAVSVVGICTC